MMGHTRALVGLCAAVLLAGSHAADAIALPGHGGQLASNACNLLLQCPAELNAQCISGRCACGEGTLATADGTRCEADGTASLGDRLVLERKYIRIAKSGGAYDTLPLNVTSAEDAGWTVSPNCVAGRGREATSDLYSSALHLWYDNHGWIIGYEVVVPSAKLNHHVCKDDGKHGSRCGVMFRRPSDACGATAWPKTGAKGSPVSIGDRLFFPYWGSELPLTRKAVESHSPPFLDTPCIPNMGHHYAVLPVSLNPLGPIYYEKSGVINGLLLGDLLPGRFKLPTPPFEKFGPEFGYAFSIHLYFKDHMGACKK